MKNFEEFHEIIIKEDIAQQAAEATAYESNLRYGMYAYLLLERYHQWLFSDDEESKAPDS